MSKTSEFAQTILLKTATLFMVFKKGELRDLLSLVSKDSYFIFNDILCKKIDGVAIESLFGPLLANVFLAYHEQNWLDSSPLQYVNHYAVDGMLKM